MKSEISRKIFSYNCKLFPLTPIQVGSGNELSPYDYVIKNKKYYRIDINDVIEKFPENRRDKLLKLLESNNMIQIRAFLNESYEQEYGYIYMIDVDSEFMNMYHKKLSGAIKSNEENELSITEFIGNSIGKFIPGSTIKGAIRSAFLASKFSSSEYYILDRNKNNKTKPFILMDRNNQMLRDKEAKREADRREARMLGLTRLEPKFDPFKQVIITDTACDGVNFIVTKMSRVSKKAPMPMGACEVSKSKLGRDKDFSLDFKVVLKNLDIPFYICDKLSAKESRDGTPIVNNLVKVLMKSIIESLNEKAKRMIKSDKLAFRAFANREGENACEQLEKEMEKLQENEAMIRIGKGAGFNSTTFNQFNKKEESVGSRVMVNKLPVGWAKIVFEEEK
ncbi:type III-A CRISPR-associated RAMP protein Csm5 [Fusobacterium sp. PH5-44]|uniref:type III-A CRISPR-associated RAMP protein Csm5 n=1 Tax=unclassified Fusobacterium TaxID=2648384 RepID=UPI003D260E15